MNFEFHPEAEREIHEAALRYELDVPGLGRRFADEVERAVEVLLDHPEMGARLDDDLRHFALRKFPFRSSMPLRLISFPSSPSRTAAASQGIGGLEFTIVDRELAVLTNRRPPVTPVTLAP
jgi:plasmid stabilization system protein ParE